MKTGKTIQKHYLSGYAAGRASIAKDLRKMKGGFSAVSWGLIASLIAVAIVWVLVGLVPIFDFIFTPHG